uniref:Retrovirus-related Pol polyprotein from transposon 297 family n=1 Tax=Cajanus cajan TaxID=3821 RepID=A0A151SQL8_CAJCA|nr:Retrovirus-related Pol polyprotein from transposon 297 family [Cajanus cajan]
MPGLDHEIIKHKLPIKSRINPVKQKPRRVKPEWSLKIKEEIQKQLDAEFFIVSQYPEWLSNIVPVLKKKWESMSLCGLFITPWGTFYYQVMPFGLKNVGETYQRAMVILFHDMIHKEIKVYIDDMIAKSKSKTDHLVHLRKLFNRLRKYQLKLNLAKCTFRVRSGKLLGFLVSEKGIEVYLDKAKAIIEMPTPKMKKEECQIGFDRIKQCLTNPLILMPPIKEKPLILYLTVLEGTMGCMLGHECETNNQERVINYLSNKFTDYKTRYSPLERTCCALVWTAQ